MPIRGLKTEKFETTFRLTTGAFFTYVLTVFQWDFVPLTMRTFMAFMVVLLSQLFPTLMFAILGPIMIQFFVNFFCLLSFTLLLAAAAAGGTGGLVGTYAAWVMWIGGLRYDPKNGPLAAIININTLFPMFNNLQIVLDGGMDVVKGFWTTYGTQNVFAMAANTMIGWGWIVLLCSIPIIIPPWRTARNEITTRLIPSILNDLAKLIRLRLKTEYESGGLLTIGEEEEDEDTTTEAGGGGLGGGDDSDDEEEELDDDDGGLKLIDSDAGENLEPKLIERLSRSAIMLRGGMFAIVTANEPQIFRCAKPVCTWKVLQALLLTVLQMIFRVFTTTKLAEQLTTRHEEAANILERAAQSLKSGGDDALRELAPKSPDNEAKLNLEREDRIIRESFRGGRDSFRGSSEIQHSFARKSSLGSSGSAGSSSRSFKSMSSRLKQSMLWSVRIGEERQVFHESDPYRLMEQAKVIEGAVEDWNSTMARERDVPVKFDDMTAREAFWMNTLPWIMGWFGFAMNLFDRMPRFICSPINWKRSFDPKLVDGLKTFSLFKYALGAVLLMVMSLYWEGYKNFGVGGQQQFQGWSVIAYTLAQTHTTEGTVKKGALRLCGTFVGAFSAWLALLACTWDDKVNRYGLVAWLTVTTGIATHMGVGEDGFQARMGLSPDFGYAIQLFSITQTIITLEANVGRGTRDALVLNRLIANVAGVLMSTVISLIPPQVLAGSPRSAFMIWDFLEEDLVSLIHLVLDRSCGAYEDEEAVAETADMLNHVFIPKERYGGAFAEAFAWLNDGKKFSAFPLFRIDPALGKSYGRLIIIHSRIIQLRDRAVLLLARKQDRAMFAPGKPLNAELTFQMNSAVSRGSFPKVASDRPSDWGNPRQGLVDFVELVQVVVSELRDANNTLSQVKYGLMAATFDKMIGGGDPYQEYWT